MFGELSERIYVATKAEFFISGLALQGIGIIIISSELPEVIKISERILVITEGRIRGELLREEATEEKIVSCAVVQS